MGVEKERGRDSEGMLMKEGVMSVLSDDEMRTWKRKGRMRGWERCAGFEDTDTHRHTDTPGNNFGGSK
jgi:hypothetical protein